MSLGVLPYFSTDYNVVQVPNVLNPVFGAQQYENVISGYRFPYLPDFLTDPSLVEGDETSRIRSVLKRWTDFVSGLWKYKSAAFSLRFISHPDNGSLEIAFLTRLSAQRGQGKTIVGPIAEDIRRVLNALHLPVQPVEQATELNALRLPFSNAHLVELRQHEEVIQFMVPSMVPNYDGPQSGYVVHPYTGAISDWYIPFETLLAQQNPVMVNVHLEPTSLRDDERYGMALAASLSQTLSDYSIPSGLYYQGSRIVDPQASQVARLYSSHLKSLTEPFLMTVQVVSPDTMAAFTTARTFGSSMVTRHQTDSEHNELPSGFDTYTPTTVYEQRTSLHTLNDLVLADWGPTQSLDWNVRLRYLVDAVGASTAFRLPISIRTGTTGIQTHRIRYSDNSRTRQTTVAPDEIVLGEFRNGGLATIHLQELKQHGLIAGFTGTGKTTTCLSILEQLWCDKKIPFWVIEPEMKNYRGFLIQPGFEDLLVFTLGDETVSPFRLNPFELLPGIRLETHISALRTCFDASFATFGVLPNLIEKSLHQIYTHKGWGLMDKGEANNKPFPTMSDFYNVMSNSIEDYKDPLKSDLRAAISNRVGSLLLGSKGRMFNTQHSILFETLMRRPVVFELDSLNETEKALVMMFILTYLREHCKLRRTNALQHITLIEEAHLVMANDAPRGSTDVTPNTQAAGAHEFSKMLAEIRNSGEGLIIAEQSPTKLIPDAIANTNLKIVHQLLSEPERNVIAATSLMDEKQKTDLGSLPIGQAALFMSGYEKASFMGVRNYKKEARFNDRLEDEIVISKMASFREANSNIYTPFDGCQYCGAQCKYRDIVNSKITERHHFNDVQNALNAFNPEAIYWAKNWQGVAKALIDTFNTLGKGVSLDLTWCLLIHLIDTPVTESMRRQYESAFHIIIKQANSKQNPENR